MATWKLIRQCFENEEYIFSDGENVTIGRGYDNKIILRSIVISRNHCVINSKDGNIVITDLKSSNGIYIGKKKIPQNTPYKLNDSDIIGIGWADGVSVSTVSEDARYVFRLVRENILPIRSRLTFQNDNELNLHTDQLEILDIKTELPEIVDIKEEWGVDNFKTKRKLEEFIGQIKTENVKRSRIFTIEDDIIDISDDEYAQKKRSQNELCEAFEIKQEQNFRYDDDPIEIDSDDGSCEEWLQRLSQSSPGKPIMPVKPRQQDQESSYSQSEDIDEEIYYDDLIKIPLVLDENPDEPEPQFSDSEIATDPEKKTSAPENIDIVNINQLSSHEQITHETENKLPLEQDKDVVDGHSAQLPQQSKLSEKFTVTNTETQYEKHKKAQMIEPLLKGPKKRIAPPAASSCSSRIEYKQKANASPTKHRSNKKHLLFNKYHMSNSQKEERKKKLKELATKQKEEKTEVNNEPQRDKVKVIAKVTATNRGAYLAEADINNVDKKNESSTKSLITKDKETELASKNKTELNFEDVKKTKKRTERVKSHHINENIPSKNKKDLIVDKQNALLPVIPSQRPKPLSDNGKVTTNKPLCNVQPLSPRKAKKSVRFSEAEPAVRYFEIEEGNRLTSTSLAKTTLVHVAQKPVFSLEKITLMKILAWNPHWLAEQVNNSEPPPILGHNNPPRTIFHHFKCHEQYVQLVGDLLLMEIWEYLTQGFTKTKSTNNSMQMRIEHLPSVAPKNQGYELFNLSVNVPTSAVRFMPRNGEVMLVEFGPENARNQRFFFVHNVRNLPSPPNNVHSFFSISLHTCYTKKLISLKQGELLIGWSLAYINNELMLFQAMEYLAGSPLNDAILRPEPKHFVKPSTAFVLNNPWTSELNQSQRSAVCGAVSAALGNRPSIQMVQGPPGTGKSSVICSIVMSYFYDSNHRQQNKGIILICATSNAAVDELVLRLLKIRQDLKKEFVRLAERFRMVRVGRAESMHPRARDVSSQQLAQRDAARLAAEPASRALGEEISFLEGKLNMWKTNAQSTQDPERVAFCESRVAQFNSKIALLRNSGGGVNSGTTAMSERRIIEGAHIVVTTLASACNAKMRGLKGRIALCIVDEAGQASEPELLAPLTLDVTKLLLVGDPRQLPGFICSQRAKEHGLGESLFSRLSQCSESWAEGSPVALLNCQYRMHPDIAHYPNRAFYGGLIMSPPLPRPDLGIPPYVIVGISSGDKGQGPSGGNELEAWGVSRLVRALVPLARPRGLQLAVITPYNGQKDLLKKNLKILSDPNEPPVEVNTVDSFQGQERDIVVVSLARSHGVGFLQDAGRMNVMLTRAKHALIICLNPHALMRNSQWSTLVKDAEKRKLYTTLPTKICQGPQSGQITDDDVLNHVRLRYPCTDKGNRS